MLIMILLLFSIYFNSVFLYLCVMKHTLSIIEEIIAWCVHSISPNSRLTVNNMPHLTGLASEQ